MSAHNLTLFILYRQRFSHLHWLFLTFAAGTFPNEMTAQTISSNAFIRTPELRYWTSHVHPKTHVRIWWLMRQVIVDSKRYLLVAVDSQNLQWNYVKLLEVKRNFKAECSSFMFGYRRRSFQDNNSIFTGRRCVFPPKARSSPKKCIRHEDKGKRWYRHWGGQNYEGNVAIKEESIPFVESYGKL